MAHEDEAADRVRAVGVAEHCVHAALDAIPASSVKGGKIISPDYKNNDPKRAPSWNEAP